MTKEAHMQTRELTTLYSGGGYFEGPRWHDGRWWVSDLPRQGVYAYTTDGDEEQILDLGQRPSGLGWLPDGSLLFVTMHDHKVWRRDPDGTVSLHADVTEFCGGDLNDLVVDREGRAYVGNFGFDVTAGADPATTSVVCIAPDGTVRVAAEDLMFPNGMVITADDRTFIVGEGLIGRYTAFSIGENGALSDRRTWAVLSPMPSLESMLQLVTEVEVVPDGCCIDAENAVWVADAKGARCIRVVEGGDIVEEIAAPDGLSVYACMLGGADRRTLLLCCAPGGLAPNLDSVGDGTLLTTEVDVPGAGRP
jgi:sugar lactone lactonase YvrE